MMLGHLAPFGPIAAAVERRWRPEWPPWTRMLLWAAALAGCVFPDLDIIANILFNGVWRHLYYLPHSLLPYLPVLALGWLLVRRQRARLVGLTLLTFWASVLSHLLLDAVSHGTVLLYPLWRGPVGWTYPRISGHFLLDYVRSPNVWLEVGVLVAAGVWWLNRYAHLWGRAWFARKRKAPLGHLTALPRHEGSRLLQFDKFR
jgi:hypothetical protein